MSLATDAADSIGIQLMVDGVAHHLEAPRA